MHSNFTLTYRVFKDIKKLLPKDSSEAASTKYQVISKASSSIKQEVKDEKTGIESDDNWSDEEHGEEKKKVSFYFVHATGLAIKYSVNLSFLC